MKNIVDKNVPARFAPKPGVTFDLTANKMDRCHRLSFNSIRRTIEKYLHWDISDKQMDTVAYAIIGNDPEGQNKWPTIAKKLKVERSAIQQQQPSYLAAEKQAKKSTKVANSTLNLLNNASENVSLGSAPENRAISDRNDFSFDRNQSAQNANMTEFSLSPLSRRHAEIQVKDQDLRHPLSRGRTAAQPTVFSSHINDGRGGEVPLQEMSPRSSLLISKL